MGKVICRYDENAPLKAIVDSIIETKKNIKARHDFLSHQMRKLEKEAKSDLNLLWDRIEKEIDAQKLLPLGMSARSIPIKIDEDVGCIRFSETPSHPFQGPFFPSAG